MLLNVKEGQGLQVSGANVVLSVSIWGTRLPQGDPKEAGGGDSPLPMDRRWVTRPSKEALVYLLLMHSPLFIPQRSPSWPSS